MNKTYIKYLNENLGVIDSATSAYDNTDQEEVPSDVFLDPNAPALNLYANGDAFNIHDNSALYEVIKIFKEFTDREPEFQSVNYAIDVNNKRLIFSVISSNDYMVTKEVINGVVDALRVEIEKKFGKTFEINTEEKDLFGQIGQDVGLGPVQGKKEVKVIVSEKIKKDKND